MRKGNFVSCDDEEGNLKSNYAAWLEKEIIRLQDLANDAETKDSGLHLQRVSQQSELLKFLNWLDAQYHDKHYPNINEGIVDNYLKNFNCG